MSRVPSSSPRATPAVRAVGTQSDVYRKRSGTTVTVVEGRVAVSGPAHPAPLLLPNPSDKEGQGTRHLCYIEWRKWPEARPRTAQEKAGLVTPAGEVFVSAGEQVTVTDQTVAEPKRTNIAAKNRMDSAPADLRCHPAR